MRVENAPGCGQPESSPSVFGREKRLKQMVTHILANAGAVVLDADFAAIVDGADAHTDFSAPVHRLGAVDQQVQQDLT